MDKWLKKHKWFLFLVVVVFIFSAFPMPHLAKTANEDVFKELRQLLDEAENIELADKTEPTKQQLLAALEEAEAVIQNEQASEKVIDQAKKKLEQAMQNLQKRGPPVKVDVRVEGHDRTIVKKTTVEVEPFDLRDYVSDYEGDEPLLSDEPKAIHAIIRALETATGLDLKDPDQFELTDQGNYIKGIGEYKVKDSAGWLYVINHQFVMNGVADETIEDGDSIVLYYVQNYMDSTYTWFEKDVYTANVGEPLQVKLHAQSYGDVSYENITLLVDDELLEENGSPVYVDEDGYATITFHEPGTYHLSAVRNNQSGEVNISRPYAIVQVNDHKKADTAPPVIKVDHLTDGQVVHVPNISFKVNAHDDVDGNIKPVVRVNGKEIDGESGLYETSLIEGKNTVTIIAKDKAGNEAKKEFTVIYSLPNMAVAVDQAILSVVDHMLEKGVMTEWQAIGLARAGMDIPNDYIDRFYRNVESQITNALESGRINITNIERLALAAMALKLDPTDIAGLDLIELIYNSPMHRNGSDTMTMQGNNGLAFALITLDAGNFEVPENAKWTREKIIAEILEGQKENGGWSLNKDFALTSVDVTAMVLTALAPYQDRPDVKAAIDKALDYLKNEQIESGGFSEPFVGGETSEATAQVIIALTALGIDPTGEPFTKSQHLVQHLLSFQNEDGGFAHTKDYPNTNSMATEQALLGLLAYKLYLEGEGPLYKFVVKPEPDEEESEEFIFKEVEVKPGETIAFQNEHFSSKAKLTMPDNLPEGTKLSVNIPEIGSLPKIGNNLRVSGDYFDITLHYPDGKRFIDGEFLLTLGVDPDVDMDVANIYHFDGNDWERVEAYEKDVQNRTITVNVSDFSIYAVLAEENEGQHTAPGDADEGLKDDEEPAMEKEPENDASSDKNDPQNKTDKREVAENGNHEGQKEERETQQAVNKQSNAENNEALQRDENDRGEKHQLPNTATAIYNIMLAGFAMVLVGVFYYMLQRRKGNI